MKAPARARRRSSCSPSVPLAAQAPESVDPAAIPNYAVVKPGLAAAGRPSEEGLRQLKAQASAPSSTCAPRRKRGCPRRRRWSRARGSYVHVPVTAATFSGADVDAVQAVLDDTAAGPVLLHCASANRVGAVWAVIQARAGQPIDEAIAEGKRVGLRSAP